MDGDILPISSPSNITSMTSYINENVNKSEVTKVDTDFAYM